MTSEIQSGENEAIDMAEKTAATYSPHEDSFFSNITRVATGDGNGRIIPRAVNARLIEARELVIEAKNRAEAITQEIERELEAARVSGLEIGRKEMTMEMAVRLHKIEQQSAAFFRDAENVVLDISFAVARKFIDTNLEDHGKEKIIADTIAKHTASRPYLMNISTGTQARATVENALASLRERNPDVVLPEILVNSSLPPDRAVLKTEFGVADLDITSQLEALRMAIAAQALSDETDWRGR